jgi:hypothetical protein
MDLMFTKKDSVEGIAESILKHIYGKDKPIIALPNLPTILQWEGYPDLKMKFMYDTSNIAKHIVQALNCFENRRALLLVDQGLIYVMIVESDVVELPAIFNSPIAGSA